MGGIGLLVVFIAYIWLAISVGRWGYRNFPRVPALVIAVSLWMLPFVDAVVGRGVLKARCSLEGAVVVNETIREVEGIGVGYGVYEDSPKYYGYRYVEGGHAYNSSWMFERAETDSASGRIQIKKKVSPIAEYVLREGPRQDSAYFFKTRFNVYERSSRREIAAFDWFAFRGGWVERVMMAFSDAGPGEAAACGGWKEQHQKTVEMLHLALQPAPTASAGTPVDSAHAKN